MRWSLYSKRNLGQTAPGQLLRGLSVIVGAIHVSGPSRG
jgi:hypothetical protein